jgi:hypothetical protein
MKSQYAQLVLLAALSMAGALACESSTTDNGAASLSERRRPSIDACGFTVTKMGSDPTHTHNSGPFTDDTWQIKNTGSVNLSITNDIPNKDGHIASVSKDAWVIFPHTLTPMSTIDADVSYNTGAVGSGSVGDSIVTNCGTKAGVTFLVTIN